MILTIKKILFIFITSKFNTKINLSYLDLNFRKIDFTNHNKIKSFIFKKNFYVYKNKNVQSFDFLNFSNKLGGKVGINLSKKAIFGWYKLNKNKLNAYQASPRGGYLQCEIFNKRIILGGLSKRYLEGTINLN